MLDPGPCQTCPRATGTLLTPTGVYHTCPPEEWRVCKALYRASKATAATGLEMRRKSHRREWALVRKSRSITQLVRRLSAK